MNIQSPPIDRFAGRFDRLLRGESAGSLWRQGTAAVLALMIYGGCMGSHGLWTNPFDGGQWTQVLFSAVKAPFLLTITFFLSLPSFFVFNALAGLASDFGAACRAVAAAQTSMAAMLLTLAPLTLFWYASSPGYLDGVLVNAAMFSAASIAAQAAIRRHYRPLIARNPRHRNLLKVWIISYAFVGIQMGWVLRPFIGNPDTDADFLREDGWGNAYIMIIRIVGNTIGL